MQTLIQISYHAGSRLSGTRGAYTNLCSRDSGFYPLTGFRERNTYHLFAERADQIVAREGRVGMVVKTGIGSAENCLPLFKKLSDNRQLVSLFDFVNTKRLFPDVQTVERFSLLTFTGERGAIDSVRFATLCQSVSDLSEPGRQYTLSPEDIALMSPAGQGLSSPQRSTGCGHHEESVS